MRIISWVVARAAYPGIVVSSLVFASRLLDRGVAVGLVVTSAFVLALGLTALLEQIQPFDRDTRATWLDAAYLGLASVVQTFGRLLGQAFATVLGVLLVSHFGPRPWPHGWPLWTQIALAVTLADLGKYWIHRVAHERAWLWRFHAEHHAPAQMYSLNGVRLHPVNLLWNVGLDAGVPLALGLDGRAVILAAVFRGTISVLQHANAELSLGPLNWIFSTPQLHRWHHSAVLREANANYGSTFIVWDVLFGTRLLPSGRPAALGLADGTRHPRHLWKQLAWPWCAQRCVATVSE